MPESAEISLASNPEQAGLTRQNANVLPGTTYVAEVVQFQVPPEATAATVTTVKLRLGVVAGQVRTNKQPVEIQLRRTKADGSAPLGNTDPPGAILATVLIPLADLADVSSGAVPPDVIVTIPGVAVDPTKKYGVCVCPRPFSVSCYVQIQLGGTQTPADMGYCTSLNGGASWGPPVSGRDLSAFEVRGTYTTP